MNEISDLVPALTVLFGLIVVCVIGYVGFALGVKLFSKAVPGEWSLSGDDAHGEGLRGYRESWHKNREGRQRSYGHHYLK